MENTNLITGDKIKKLRLEKGYTQKQLAEKCGMYESQIRKYETGKANPKIETLMKIATALGVNISSLKSDLELTGDKIISYLQYEADQIDIFNNYIHEIGEFLYYNPKHKELFDASMEVKPEDVYFAKEMLDRINGKMSAQQRKVIDGLEEVRKSVKPKDLKFPDQQDDNEE